MDTVDALERLQKLREAGAITDDEFLAQKTKILRTGDEAVEDFQPYSQDYSADYISSMGRGKKAILGIVAVGIAVGTVFGGLYLSFNQDDEIPFSLPTDENPTASGATEAPVVDDYAVEPNVEIPALSYEFEIETTVQPTDFGDIRRYFLNNKSTSQVALSFVKVNKRDDCIAYIREKLDSASRRVITLSQDFNAGEVTSGALDVGKSVEIKYDQRMCGEIVYADVTMLDGVTYSMKAL